MPRDLWGRRHDPHISSILRERSWLPADQIDWRERLGKGQSPNPQPCGPQTLMSVGFDNTGGLAVPCVGVTEESAHAPRLGLL